MPTNGLEAAVTLKHFTRAGACIEVNPHLFFRRYLVLGLSDNFGHHVRRDYHDPVDVTEDPVTRVDRCRADLDVAVPLNDVPPPDRRGGGAKPTEEGKLGGGGEPGGAA